MAMTSAAQPRLMLADLPLTRELRLVAAVALLLAVLALLRWGRRDRS